jgi:c(7)-type cytochrome triheme protein
MKSRFPLGLAIVLILFVACSAFGINIPDVTFSTKQAGKVVFSHNFHITQKGISNNCKACHDALFDMKKKTRHTMAEMEQGKSCGACHNGTAAFGLPECTRCHKVRDVVIKVRETGPVTFRHSQHTVKGSCSDCHNKLFNTGPNKHVSMAQMEKGQSCGACHNGKAAFSVSECAKCHPVKDVNFPVKSISDVRFSHTFHTGLYSCKKCHTRIYRLSGGEKAITMAAMVKGASCGACHDGKTAFSVSGNCDKCHKH